jgi:hypothetical protein
VDKKDLTIGISCNKCNDEGVLCLNSCCPFEGLCLMNKDASQVQLKIHKDDNTTSDWTEDKEFIFVGPIIEDEDFFTCEGKVIIDFNTSDLLLHQNGSLMVQEGKETTVYESKDYCILDNNKLALCQNTQDMTKVLEKVTKLPTLDMNTIDVMPEEHEESISDNSNDLEDDKLQINDDNLKAIRNVEKKIDSLSKKFETINWELSRKLDLILNNIAGLQSFSMYG